MVVLVAAVLYVFAVNDVRARKSELTQVTANAASWQAAANSYASYVTAAQQQKQQLTDIRAARHGPVPVVPASQPDRRSDARRCRPELAAGDRSVRVGARRRQRPRRPRGRRRRSQPHPDLRAAPRPESAVAATMVQLRRVPGVSAVSLSSSTDGTSRGTTAATAASGSPTGAAGARSRCPFSDVADLSAPTAARLQQRGHSHLDVDGACGAPAAHRDHPGNRERRPMTLRQRDRIVLASWRQSALVGGSTCWPSSQSARRPARSRRRSPPSSSAARVGSAELSNRSCGAGCAEDRRRRVGRAQARRASAVRHPRAAAATEKSAEADHVAMQAITLSGASGTSAAATPAVPTPAPTTTTSGVRRPRPRRRAGRDRVPVQLSFIGRLRRAQQARPPLTDSSRPRAGTCTPPAPC